MNSLSGIQVVHGFGLVALLTVAGSPTRTRRIGCRSKPRVIRGGFMVALSVLLVGSTGLAHAQLCPQNFDGVTAPALPVGWTSANLAGTASAWSTSTGDADTAPNAAFAADEASVADNALISPATVISAANSTFYFRHRYAMERGFDGGVLEISINGGGFADILTLGGNFSTGGYNASISSVYGSPIAGQPAWSGDSDGFVTTSVALPAAAMGETIVMRWRATSDSSFSDAGWYVDSIACGAPAPPPPSAWNLAASYPIPILDQGMATRRGAIYSFGGVSGGAVVPSSYRFYYSSWTPIASLPVAVEIPAVTSDGQYLYVIGGVPGAGPSSADGYLYDPIINTYQSIATSPTATWASAAVYLDGKIYKIGGYIYDGSGSVATNAVEAYNVAGNNWTSVAPYPIAVGHLSAFAHAGYIYAAGGLGAGSELPTLKTYRYDPATNLWDDAAFADLPDTRWGAAASAFHDGALLAGGYVAGNASGHLSATAIQWNAQSNRWRALPPMQHARARFGGGVLHGCFYAVGGRNTSGGFAGTADNQEFDCLFYDGFDP